MSPRYMEALVEVDYVINMLEPEELKKIPESFRDFIFKNKDKRYEISSAENLKEETLAILAVIYRKYLASSEERELLEKEYQEKLKQENAEIQNNRANTQINYAPQVIKKNNTASIENEKKNIAILEYTNKKWYEKLIDKIKSILRIK